MEEILYKLIFEAQTQPGYKKKTVKKNLKELLKADRDKMKRLFSGQPVVIRKNLPEERIRPYEKAMVKAGACCRIMAVKDGQELPPVNAETLAIIENTESIPVTRDNDSIPKIQSLSAFDRLGRIRFMALCWLVVILETSAWFVPEYLRQLFGAILTIQETMMLITGLHTLAGLTFIIIAGLRLHDLDRSAWLWVFLLIPGLNLLFLLWLAFARGSSSGNSFGRVPSEPRNMARLFGLWIPLLLVVAVSGSAWFHQEELQQLASSLPGNIMNSVSVGSVDF